MFVVPVQIVSVQVCLAWQLTSEGMCGRRPRRTLFCELFWTNEGLDFSVGKMTVRVQWWQMTQEILGITLPEKKKFYLN